MWGGRDVVTLEGSRFSEMHVPVLSCLSGSVGRASA